MVLIEELEGIELGKPCQRFKSNGETENCAPKFTIFYLGTSFRGLLLTSSGAISKPF